MIEKNEMMDFKEFIIDLSLCADRYQYKLLSEETLQCLKSSINKILCSYNRAQDYDFEVDIEPYKINVNLSPKTKKAFNEMKENMPDDFKGYKWDNEINGVVKDDDEIPYKS